MSGQRSGSASIKPSKDDGRASSVGDTSPLQPADEGDPPAGDTGPQDARKGPTRTCIVTRTAMPVDKMLRFVRGPDGTVVPDLSCRLPGRGVWLTATAKHVRQAVEKKIFSRAFKAETRAAASLPADVEALLRKHALQSLSLANKSGRLLAGFEKVDAALGKGNVAILVSANDGSEDGIGKLRGKARAIAADGGREPMHMTLFTSDELSLSLGRSRVIHACLEASGMTAAVLKDCLRLEAYLASEPATGLDREQSLGHR